MAQNTLRKTRLSLGITKLHLAELMGMPMRTYDDLEAGKSQIRDVHLIALEMALLRHAIETRNASQIPADLKRLILSAAALIETENV